MKENMIKAGFFIIVGIAGLIYSLWLYSEYSNDDTILLPWILPLICIAYIILGLVILGRALPGYDEVLGRRILDKMKTYHIKREGGTYSFSLPDARTVYVWKYKIEISSRNESFKLDCSYDLRKKMYNFCVSNVKEKKDLRKIKSDLLDILK